MLKIQPAFILVSGVLLAANGWTAPDLNAAADDACKCLAEPYAAAGKIMTMISEARTSGNMTPIMESQEEMMALAEVTSACFETMTKKYPDIAASAELKGKVMAISDQQCPNPMKGFMSMFNPQGLKGPAR